MYLAVCDDQQSELNELTALLAQWQSERQTAIRFRTFSNPIELLDTAAKEPFTSYFLDVIMPGTDGLAAAREIRNFDETVDIVFLTSSPEFAYESYSVHALDYLLKPVQPEKLFALLDRLLLKEQKPEEGLTVKCGTTLIRILFSQLSYVEIIGKHLYFNLTDGTVYKVSGTLKEYEPQLLSRPEFLKTHRSYIVNMLQITELSPANIRTFSGKIIPVSRLLYPQLQKEYMNLLFSGRNE